MIVIQRDMPGIYFIVWDGKRTSYRIDRPARSNADTGANSSQPLWVIYDMNDPTTTLFGATTLREAKRWAINHLPEILEA